MTTRQELARAAVSAALRFRASAGVSAWQPLCPVELALNSDVDVRFVEIPSMEGMYWKKGSPVILLGSERPPGRQAFTCAHELGHHVFKHGTRIDEVLGAGETRGLQSTEEYVANVFAAFLLMPKSAVDRAFAIRGFCPNAAGPAQVYIAACALGVGYATLIRHIQLSLREIPKSRAAELLKETPKAIRTEILKESAETDLIVVDEHWDALRAVDLQVGDFAVFPKATQLEGTMAHIENSGQTVVIRAIQPGIGRAVCGSWASFVRVSKRRYAGRAAFRFLEEPDD